MNRIPLILVIISLLLAGCKPVSLTPTPSPTVPTLQATQPLDTPQPAATRQNTAAPQPTQTAQPSQTALPPLPTGNVQPLVARSSPTPNDPVIDCKGALPGDKLKLVYEWTGSAEEQVKAVFKPLVDACGIVITSQAISDPGHLGWKISELKPDILFSSQKLAFTLYRSSFLDLTTLGADAANYSRPWIDMGTVNGKWLALPVEADNRSIVWYNPIRFKAYGYEVPTTLDALNSLVEQMVKDGRIPWSMGFERGKDTGSLGGIFIENLLLAQQGQQFVHNVISFKTLFNDPGIFQAFQLYKTWSTDPLYTTGGAQGTLTTNYRDAINNVFKPKPAAMLVSQSGTNVDEIMLKYPDFKFGVDYDFFPFPGLKDAQVGAQYLLALKDTPAVRAMSAYLSGPLGAKAWMQSNLAVSPIKLAVKYTGDALRRAEVEALAKAESYVPSFGDAMPVIDDPPGRPFVEAQNEALVLLMERARIKAILDNVTEDEGDASLWNSSSVLP